MGIPRWVKVLTVALIFLIALLLFAGRYILTFGIFALGKGEAVTVRIEGNWNSDGEGEIFKDMNRFALFLDENGWNVSVDYIERASAHNKDYYSNFSGDSNSEIYGIQARKPFYSFIPGVPIENLYIRIYEKGDRYHKVGSYYLKYTQFSHCKEDTEERRQKYLRFSELVEKEYGIDIVNAEIYFGNCALFN